MKKIIALAIAVLMLAAFAVPAFAEEATPPNHATEVTYTIGETYVFTVDATIELSKDAAVDETAGTINLTVSNFNIFASHTLTITATAEEGLAGNVLTLKGKDVNNEDTAVVTFDGGLSATFASDALVLTNAFVATWTEKPEVADNYSNIITFNATIA